LVSTDAKGGVYVAEVTGVPLVVIVPVPQPPVVGLVTRVKVTPPFLESFAIVAVMVTFPAPASTVEEEPVRLTPIAGEPPPQAKIIERKTHETRTREIPSMRRIAAPVVSEREAQAPLRKPTRHAERDISISLARSWPDRFWAESRIDGKYYLRR
jgi:hypothetical protein